MKTAPPPTGHDIRPEENHLSARAAWGLALLFCGLMILPGIWREFSSDPVRGALAHIAKIDDGSAVERIRAAEKYVNEGQWTKPIRRAVQRVLWRAFHEGNRKVLVGHDGWLYHRPGLRALTGRGPMLPHIHSVSKDHELRYWEGCVPVIKDFAAQLHERGLQLLLVPVPDKASRAVPATLSPWVAEWWDLREDMSSLHPDWGRFVKELQANGITVYRPEGGAYLKTDTHWQAAWVRDVAQRVAEWARQLLLKEEAPPPVATEGQIRKKTAKGDLITALDMGGTDHLFPPETVALPHPLPPPAVSDLASDIVLLGDSNVNMYDDPSLPFHEAGAGLASWLSAALGQPLHIIAINGGGATKVRQEFARLPDDVVRAKKLVIWVLAERDLLMDAAVAKENNVEWKRVVFNPARSAPPQAEATGALVAEVTLTAKSALQDVAQANYPDAVYVALAAVEHVLEGDYPEKEMQLVLWNFRGKEVQPSARYNVGQKLRVTLVPWLEKGSLTSTNLSDDFNRFDIPLLYVEHAEPR